MKVDLIIKNVNIYNSFFKRFSLCACAILDGKFLYIGKDDISKLSGEKEIDGYGMYMIPGLIDIHMHIESSMATPDAFSHQLIKNGVTTIVSEPHEIANVFGVQGVEEMIENGKNAIVDIFYSVPSSVPSTSSYFETTGYEIGIEEISKLMESGNFISLGEVMNYYDIINNKDSKINTIIKFFKENYKALPIEGHCPKLMGLDLSKFIFNGVDSDHTQQTRYTLSERIKNGMFIEIQEKSISKENLDFLIENSLYEHFAFVTDDVMADTFSTKGHLNKLVKKAMDLGMTPENAIYNASYTAARRMGLKDRGAIAPGKIADFLLVSNIENLIIEEVYKDGLRVYDVNKPYVYKESTGTFPDKFYKSIVMNPINDENLMIKAPIENGEIKCRIIEVNRDSNFTKEIIQDIQVKNGFLEWENTKYLMIAVFERYGKNGNISLGLVTGDTIKKGAIVTSYAHDHHNIMVVGSNKKDIIKAVNHLIENQGGIYAVLDEEIIAGLELKVAGLISEKSIDNIGLELEKVRLAMKSLGYVHNNPIMSFCTNSLPVSQLLKITDMGLIKLSENKIVDLILEEK